MLKKIYQELVAIRKELQAIRGGVEFIRKHPFNVLTSLGHSPSHNNKSVRDAGITIDLPTRDIQPEAEGNK